MTVPTWTAVDDLLADLLVGPDPALDAALAESDAAGLPAISVTPNQGKLLQLIARIADGWHWRPSQCLLSSWVRMASNGCFMAF